MPIGFEIHPTIGIARIGASDGFFFGPEPDQPPPTAYRDAGGILRQAARFRVFGVERDNTGRIVSAREITAADADIEWTVHLANRKATAFKVSEPRERRNNALGDDESDSALIIDPGPRSVSASVTTAAFDTGAFRGMTVSLGEARFEVSTGRLIVLAGKGRSGFELPLAPNDDPSKTPQHFADNDGWFDDTSEGPVTATLRLKATGEQPPVSAARVIVGPPDFAPDIQNFVTLYDIVHQVAIDKGLVEKPTTFSFMRFVRPVLVRASGYGWVNASGDSGHGGDGRGNFEAAMDVLANPETSAGRRPRIFRRLRDPHNAVNPSFAMPRLFSEAGYPEKDLRALALTPIQYEAMAKWAMVPTPPDFVWDSPADPWAGQALPEALDRIALEGCAGGGFFPGIEAPRFMRDAGNYEPSLPVRLKEDLSAGIVNAGSAVPWQADFYDCQWEGTRDGGTGLEAFETQEDYGWWPAQRPDSVFTDVTLEHRVSWAQGILDKREMVSAWSTRKFVLRATNQQGRTVYVSEP